MDAKARLTADERAVWRRVCNEKGNDLALGFLAHLDAAEVEVVRLRSALSEFDGMTCDHPCEHERCRRVRLVRTALGKEDKPNGKHL